MSLDDKRAMKKYEAEIYPALKKMLDAAAGFDVPVEPHWDKLTVEGRARDALEGYYLTDIFFVPLIAAVKNLAADQLGKEALKSGLKKVVMTYDAETAPISNYAAGWLFANGVFTINYEPGVTSTEPNPVQAKTQAMYDILSAGL